MNFTLRNAKTLSQAAAALLLVAPTACSGPAGMRIEETAAAEPAQQAVQAAPMTVIPVPASIVRTSGAFTITPETQVFFSGDDDAGAVATYLAQLLRQNPAERAQVLTGQPASGAINLVVDASAGVGPEGYVL